MNQICMAEIPANILEYYKIGLASVQLSQKFCMFKKKKNLFMMSLLPKVLIISVYLKNFFDDYIHAIGIIVNN